MNNTNLSGTQVTNNGNENLSTMRSDGAVVLMSPAPLKDKLKTLKKFYWGFPIILLMSIRMEGAWALALFYLMLIYTIDYVVSGVRISGLRDIQFAYDSSVGYNELLEKLIPVMLKKYGMTVECAENGMPMVKYQDISYSVLIRENNTFSIWWQLSLGGAIFKSRRYKTYKKNITMMGILAYEIQSLLGINSLNKAEEPQA